MTWALILIPGALLVGWAIVKVAADFDSLFDVDFDHYDNGGEK